MQATFSMLGEQEIGNVSSQQLAIGRYFIKNYRQDSTPLSGDTPTGAIHAWLLVRGVYRSKMIAPITLVLAEPSPRRAGLGAYSPGLMHYQACCLRMPAVLMRGGNSEAETVHVYKSPCSELRYCWTFIPSTIVQLQTPHSLLV
jgi:hypothetical protein